MLASDYDGTIATDGKILSEPERALEDLKEAGWLTALVTGRELEDLLNVCPRITLFDLVVAENGAVLYFPQTQEIIDQASAPPSRFTSELAKRDIPFSKGRIIVGTGSALAEEVTSIVKTLGLDLVAILNKDSVMFLPAGVDKASGLAAGARLLDCHLSEIVAIGDAENDLAFLSACGFSVAVRNAIDALKDVADFVTPLPNGEGVTQFIRDHILDQSGESIFRPVSTGVLD
jgi:HAD superfamily hydrolase (TIGR01484 family)